MHYICQTSFDIEISDIREIRFLEMLKSKQEALRSSVEK